MEYGNFGALALATLLSLSNPNTPKQPPTYQLPAIAGLWQLELDPALNLSCQERYNFSANGALITTSAGERTQGTYRFEYVEEVELPVLAFQTDFDNNQPDCLGNQVDQTGDASAHFVKLDSRHDPKFMQWCNDREAQDCPLKLRRILP